MSRIIAIVLLTTTLAACATRRPYVAAPVAPVSPMQIGAALVVEQPLDLQWWAQFDDPVLAALVEQALGANGDVRVAVARVQQARAAFDDTSLDRWPSVPVGAGVTRTDAATPGFSDQRQAVNSYRLGFDAYWEIDVFGRVRSAIDAAAANAGAYEATLDDVRVSVAAEVARNYFELRGIQHQQAVAERSLVNQQETLRLTRVRLDAGIGDAQDVASASARVAAIQAELPPLRAALGERANRLAVLVGERPGNLTADLRPRAYPPLGKAIAIGEPGTLLTRRPDVRVAERRLAAATAREGIAAADLYPRITVTGFLGLLAGRGSLFGKSESLAYSVAPALSWAGLDIASARARLRGAAAVTREAAAEYEQAVLLAIEEVQNALTRYHEQQARLVALVDQARESTRAADLARVRYREGLSDFLSLLDAERTQLQAENAVASAESGVFTGMIAVYKSLGGVPAPPASLLATR